MTQQNLKPVLAELVGTFTLVFIGVAVFAMIYLWRRSVIAIWLGDGLGRFLNN